MKYYIFARPSTPESNAGRWQYIKRPILAMPYVSVQIITSPPTATHPAQARSKMPRSRRIALQLIDGSCSLTPTAQHRRPRYWLIRTRWQRHVRLLARKRTCADSGTGAERRGAGGEHVQLLALFLQVLLCVVGFLVVAFALWEWGVLVELCLWEKKGKSGTG